MFVAAPATADAGPGPASGNWTGNVGPSGSYGYGSWNANASPNSVTLSARAGTLASNYCETAYFDWGLTPITHHDARAVRTCRSGATTSRNWGDSKSTIGGVQKLGACYGANNTFGTCIGYPQATMNICSIPAAFSTTNCSSSWFLRYSSGAVLFHNGESPTTATC